MTLRTGVDLLEIERLRAAVERHGEIFLKRIYTPNERADCQGNYPSLAARFAAKEAVAKALGTGIGPVSWHEIEIRRGAERAPELHLHGKAALRAAELGLSEWSLSLSHTHEHAIAFVVATGKS